MFLLAILALALVGATAALLAWASVVPRVHAMHRLGQITAYGGGIVHSSEEAAHQSSHALFDGLAQRVGSLRLGFVETL